jgi:hypothetical protein
METNASNEQTGSLGLGARFAGFVASTFATISLMVLFA